jgi:uroporphyrinogen-III decarboxylase
MLVGPENYENFALPYEQIVFDELKSYGIPSTLHICGDTTRILELMGKSRAQGVELDFQVDLPLARKRLPEDTTLIGNIEPVGVMLEAHPEKVTESVAHLLGSSSQLGQFILSTGCALAPDTSPENIHAMVKAVMNYEC